VSKRATTPSGRRLLLKAHKALINSRRSGNRGNERRREYWLNASERLITAAAKIDAGYQVWLTALIADMRKQLS
jgi:hypothetical protein